MSCCADHFPEINHKIHSDICCWPRLQVHVAISFILIDRMTVWPAMVTYIRVALIINFYLPLPVQFSTPSQSERYKILSEFRHTCTCIRSYNIIACKNLGFTLLIFCISEN